MKIVIKTIPASHQRYSTQGDYWRDKNGVYQIRVSRPDDAEADAIMVHELVEMLLCRRHDVSFRDVTAFDKAFEKKRKPGNTDEPGDDPFAPYRREHQAASVAETVYERAL